MILLNNRHSRAAGSLALVSMLALTQSPALAAQPEFDALRLPALSGDYGFTTLQSCVRTPYQAPPAAGFDPVTHALLVNAEAAEAIGSGVMSFSRDGTVSASVVGAELSVNQLAAGQTPETVGINYSCSGSYSLGAEHSVEVNFPSCSISTGDPNKLVSVGPLKFNGYMGINGRSLNLSLVDGILQKVSVANASGVVQAERQRVCVQSLSLSRSAMD